MEVNNNIIKKYRVINYDIHDKTYADEMRSLILLHPQFDLFSDNISKETHINRNSLLDAIDDYNKTEISINNPLSDIFEAKAYNCRPYNKCIIS